MDTVRSKNLKDERLGRLLGTLMVCPGHAIPVRL